MDVQIAGWMDILTDNVKTVYPQPHPCKHSIIIIIICKQKGPKTTHHCSVMTSLLLTKKITDKCKLFCLKHHALSSQKMSSTQENIPSNMCPSGFRSVCTFSLIRIFTGCIMDSQGYKVYSCRNKD